MATTTVVDPRPATSERCDRCCAAALVRAVLPAGQLLFCLHHAHVHRKRLIEVGAKLSLTVEL